MSVTYIFKINISRKEGSSLSSEDIIKCYLESDWSLFSEDKEIIYTQVGDNDDFDYLAQPLSEAEYFEIVNQKEKNKENIAFALFLSGENVRYRIDVIITPEFEILISPDDGTKKILTADLNILDVNWYFCKILMPLTAKNMIVESFSYIQM